MQQSLAMGRSRRAARHLKQHSGRSSKQRRRMFQRVAERDAWTCWLCGQHVDPSIERTLVADPEAGTLDHVLPVCHGGKFEAGNLRLAHRKCNEERGRREKVAAKEYRALANRFRTGRTLSPEDLATLHAHAVRAGNYLLAERTEADR